VNDVHGPHQSAQKYTPTEVRPCKVFPVGSTRNVYPCPSWTERTGPNMSNHGPVVDVGVGESDGPRPPGAGAGVTCHDAAMPRVMFVAAFVMAALIVACRSTGTVHTT
jgi:hypothetical protein